MRPTSVLAWFVRLIRHPGLVPGSAGRQASRLEFIGHDLRRGRPRHKAGVTVVFALLIATPALAQTAPLADTQLSDPAKEAQAKALMETIRCVECQGQAISDSRRSTGSATSSTGSPRAFRAPTAQNVAQTSDTS